MCLVNNTSFWLQVLRPVALDSTNLCGLCHPQSIVFCLKQGQTGIFVSLTMQFLFPEEIPRVFQPEWIWRSQQGHVWHPNCGGPHLPSGYFLHDQVMTLYNLQTWLFILKSLYVVPSPVPDYVKATVETVVKIHEADDTGDVLVFLTGQVWGFVS